jgi:hypothetical protein
MNQHASQPKPRPIFLSYRRTDSADTTGRLYAALRDRFGSTSVFMDSSCTAWGEDWPTVLEGAVAGADFVVVVIGPGWLVAHDEWGRRRIDQPDDWVRRELEVALERRKAVLPLLVGETRMPPPDALPAELSELSKKQALDVRDETWDRDVEAVLQSLAERVVAAAPETPASRGGTIEDEFRSVASRFYTRGVDDRNAAAGEIAALGSLLDLDAVLRFADSPTPGERVGAAIALAAHLRTSEALRADPRVQSALRALLNDPRERVRYRATKVMKDFPALVPAYEQDLSWLTRPAENWQVRGMAQQALSRAGLS